MKKVALQTLGCRTNQLESSIILEKLIENGYQTVDFSEIADFYIINTCTVTEKSDLASKSLIKKAKLLNPASKIIVAGCYSQVSPEEVAALNGVDIVVGNLEKLNILEILENLNYSENIQSKILVSDIMQEKIFRNTDVSSAGGRSRAVIKIQDGCNFQCSYCIIPYARGKSRSRELDDVIVQIENLTEKGFSEVVLSGIHLGQWGRDLNPKNTLAKLLKEIENIKTLKRYRLSSVDPMEFDEELVKALISSEKFCRHLHISLQSGNNYTLKQMKRRYTVEKYSDLIINLVDNIPFINIGSDIIVGFPGETEEQFENTLENLKKLPLGYIHVFPFSPRKGTSATLMPNQIPNSIKKHRAELLRKLANQKNLDFRQKMLGKSFEIIVENTKDKSTGLYKGMTDNFISVIVDLPENYKNQSVYITVKSINKAKTFGILADRI